MPHGLVIIGSGPAGMVAGLLFARAGLKTLALEKHRDFLRVFRLPTGTQIAGKAGPAGADRRPLRRDELLPPTLLAT
jgi:2-polyprenyl-6-methoxyphenol hydroxylase-like FAD-dependent oxidoreductase